MGMRNRKTIATDERSAVLIERRNLKMARSAHAYVRGNTLKFYEWLDGVDSRSLPDGPPVWICGDCHVGNLGPIADREGRVDVQIRDLDQTVIGNPAHDLIRLGLSLATAVRSSDLPGITTARMIEQLIEGYEAGLADEPDADAARKPDAVRVVMKQAMSRTWKHLAKERIEDTRPTIPLGKRFWPLSRHEHREVAALFESKAVRGLATALRWRDDEAEVELIDAAYWMKGCSSLGRLRLAVLLRVGGDGLSLMDVKEAVQAAAPRAPSGEMPRNNGDRVVEGARHLSPALGKRMLSARLLDRSVFLRELLPQDLKIEIDQLSRGEAMRVARFLATIVARAHARQMDPEQRRRWRSELARNRTRSLDAPSWLWTSVVALVAGHEAAYLDHCRRYAMAASAGS
ncbi:MAG: hypothetical protein JWO51_1391 [Rhodospirillales bacterium]|nr:hypothetical protein [Rhodospirillales bacterium]